MSETPASSPVEAKPVSANGADGRVGLDDIMIAMDVVDTLRHDDRIVARELNDDARREDLIKRLKEIYAGQGMEVPDRILEEGVRALEEDRFIYKPPSPSFARTFAEWYVTRMSWGRYVAGALIGLTLLLAANYAFVQRPRALNAEARQTELKTMLPAAFASLMTSIQSETQDQAVIARARALETSGRNAAREGKLSEARAAKEQLDALLGDLRAEYQIRVVSRQGELSGLWRIPEANPETYNFYLVVEAINVQGEVVPQMIPNEETSRRERVATWAVRVPREVLVAVEKDKSDDGILQNAIVGRKTRGTLDRDWSIPVAGGFITRW
ncbi:MAG: DUF6384 family protein [Pseudomonadota bacterium]